MEKKNCKNFILIEDSNYPLHHYTTFIMIIENDMLKTINVRFLDHFEIGPIRYSRVQKNNVQYVYSPPGSGI